jgi:hypothetical protein
MQGNCSEPPSQEFLAQLDPDPPLRPLLPGQCLIAGTSQPFKIEGNWAWVDNLYVGVGNSSFYDQWIADPTSRLWMTNVTVQGNGASTGGGCSGECAYNSVEGYQYLEGGLPVPRRWRATST